MKMYSPLENALLKTFKKYVYELYQRKYLNNPDLYKEDDPRKATIKEMLDYWANNDSKWSTIDSWLGDCFAGAFNSLRIDPILYRQFTRRCFEDG